MDEFTIADVLCFAELYLELLRDGSLSFMLIPVIGSGWNIVGLISDRMG